MSDYSLLLRKELKEMFSFRRKEKKKIDIAGLLITIFLTVSIIAVVVLVFGELLGTYTEIPEKLVLNKESRLLRLSEIMTFTYAVITLINVFEPLHKYVAEGTTLWHSEDPTTIIGAAIGVHVGPGAVAACFFAEE